MASHLLLFTIVSWTVLSAVLQQQAECFNLDEQVARLFSGGSEEDSLFGFSLTPHSFPNDSQSILVGAPRELESGGLRTGAVYRCDLNDSSGSCSRLEIFDRYDDQGLTFDPFLVFSPSHSSDNSSINGQLLGYSLDSLNDLAISCAPLYTPVREPVDGVDLLDHNGRCVMLHNNNLTAPYLQIPYIDEVFGPGSNSFRLLGTSVHLSPRENETYFTASSPLSGGTGIHPYGRLYQSSADPVDRNFNDMINSNTLSTDSIVDGYLGFHIELGYITVSRFDVADPQVIASAPRSPQHRGEVTAWSDVYQSSIITVASGEEANGYFGYDFAVLPQDDGYDSLVVGCPLCNLERGVVYFYVNNGGTLTSDPVRIQSPSSKIARFGLSVENIGDLDRDGFNDIAIAAPEEAGQHPSDGTDYTGVVYVYRGAPRSLMTSPSQVVYGRSTIPLFGYSLNGGNDVDHNGYPDLVIGGVSMSQNSQVKVLRGAPVVTVVAKLTVPSEALVLGNLPDHQQCDVVAETIVVCFDVMVCFNYTTLPGDVVEQFGVAYTLSSDDRVFSDPTDLTSSSTIISEVTLQRSGRLTCQTHKVYLKPALSSLDEVTFLLTIADVADLLESSNGLHPVLNVGRVTEWSELVMLNSTCGPDNFCTPNLKLSFDYTGMSPVYLTESFNITFSISVRNEGTEDGFAARVLVGLPHAGIVKLDEVEHQSRSLQSRCIPSFTRSMTLECPIKSPIAPGELISFDLVLIPLVDKVPLNTSNLPFTFQLVDEQNTTDVSTSHALTDVQSVASYSVVIQTLGSDPLVALPLTSTLNQATRINQIPNDPSSLGPLSPVNFVVRNDDENNRNSPIASSELLIFWPSQTIVQNTLFPFLIPLQITFEDRTLCMQHNLIPQGLAVEQFFNLSLPFTDTPPNPDLYPEDCPSTTCGVIICDITNLQPDDSIVIFLSSVLYSPSVTNNLVLNITSLIRSKAQYPIVEDFRATTELRVETAVQEVADDCVNVYIPIVAAVGGFVALVLIAVLLGLLGYCTRKCECYKNKRGAHRFEDDAFYGPRVVEYELEGTGGETQFTTTTASYAAGPRSASCDPSINDGEIANGRAVANGYGKESELTIEGSTDIHLQVPHNVQTVSSHSTSPEDTTIMYDERDIIVTPPLTSSKEKSSRDSLHKPTSPTVSMCSKETDV